MAKKNGFFVKLIVFLVPYLIVVAWSADNVFIGDTIQFGSEHPNYFFTHGFGSLLLPDSIDSGHPPTFGIYLAAIWKIFGRSLIASHLAMLPFIVLIVIQGIRLGTNVFPEKNIYAWWVSIIILSECALLGQSALVSPDVVVLAFFLLALNAILNNRRGLLLLAVLLLGCISMRGMMAAFALYWFSIIRHYPQRGSSLASYLIRQVIPFLPGAAVALVYFTMHYIQKGWIGYHDSSPWHTAFQDVGVTEFLTNLALIGFRSIDLGKILTVATSACLIIVWLFRTKRTNYSDADRKRISQFTWLVVCLGVCTALPLALYQTLVSHRYLIPLNFSVALLAIILLATLPVRHKNVIFTLLVICQLSGHFWRYPRYISQGWDCTLATLPFSDMRNDFVTYIDNHRIPRFRIGGHFTLKHSDFELDLKGDTTHYKDYEYGTEPVQYIWYSNVCNSRIDDHFQETTKNWTVLKREKRGKVEMILFRKPTFSKTIIK